MNRFTFLRQAYGLDVRSIELFRIGFGFTLLVDLFWRTVDLERHYTDFGVLPRVPLIEKYITPWGFSFHLFNGTSLFIGILFAAAAFFAICLILGYRTRLASIASWVLLISVQNRNPMILQGGDVFFRMLAFWAMFLPMGRLYSLDNKQKKTQSPFFPEHVSMATFGIMIQIALVYLCSGLIKYTQPSWKTGTAMYYSFATDEYNTFISKFLLGFPSLLEGITYFTLAVETVVPLLLFFPFRGARQRLVVVAVFCSFHIGIAFTLTVGLFSLIGVVAWSLLIPTPFWEWLEKKFPAVSLKSSLSTEFVPFSTVLSTRKSTEFWAFNLLCAFAILTTVWWNCTTIPLLKTRKGPPWNEVVMFFRWDQTWNMFSTPIIEDGWYVIPGVLKNGTVVDLWQDGGPLTWERPYSFSQNLKRQRVKKYMLNLYSAGNQDHRLHFGRHLCRYWNRDHSGDESLQTFRIIFMRENNLPDGTTAPVQRVAIWNHECFDGALKAFPPPQ